MKILHSLSASLLSATSILVRRVAFALLFLGAGLVVLPPCAGASGGFFEDTGSLATARFNHTATFLPDGKVLVAGGLDSSDNALASAELYDPTSGTWTATGSLITVRADHTATLLPDGKVLIAGGYGTSTLASAELYDPASGTWTTTGSLATARYFHTATLLPNGKVLVAGGLIDSIGPLASAELYDPASGTWTATGSFATARLNHTATLLPDGKVLIAGGDDNTGNVFPSTELYDPASGTWAPTGSLNTRRYSHTATLLPSGRVLVAGGADTSNIITSADLYDPASRSWTGTGSLATARIYHTATLLSDGSVLAAGGYISSNQASAELYDAASGTWTATGSLATARSDHTATLLPNGNVLVAGGYGDSGPLVSAELYHSAATTPAAQATNLSTRMRVQTGDSVGIGGFIITGTAPKHVLLRAIGPSLAQFGVPDVLADPVLELHGPGAFVTITDDNWRDDPMQEALIIADGIPPTNNLESAIDATLAPGAYTAIVRGKNNTSGVALVEVYDLSQAVPAKLADISTRAFVSTGDNIVIAGFTLGSNSGDDRIVARGIGPSLTAAGVPNALADPTLELRDSNGTLLMANNNWQDDQAQAAELMADGLAPTNPLESGIAMTLPPGLYTALLAGLSNGTGVGVVEVYDLGAP